MFFIIVGLFGKNKLIFEDGILVARLFMSRALQSLARYSWVVGLCCCSYWWYVATGMAGRGRGRAKKRCLSFNEDVIGELSNDFSKAAREPTVKQRMLQLYRDGWEKDDARERMKQERYSSSSMSKCFCHWPGGKPLSNPSDPPVAVI